jgi:hypothetical protein
MTDSTSKVKALEERMFQLSSAYLDARAVWIVAKLRIPDLLAGGQRPVAELAQAASVQPEPLQRILRLAAANGVVAEVTPGIFAVTELGELLKSDNPNTMRDWVLWAGGPLHDCFRDALHSVETGKPVFERVHGMKLYEYLKSHREDAQNLSGAMAAYGRDVVTLMKSFDFRGSSRLVDVGAGAGALAAAVLQTHPRMQATLFDLPHVVEQSHRPLEEAGVFDRCTLVPGDFFKSVPPGGDIYVLSAVLHNWTDEECVTILKNCRQAMPKQAKLLILEMLVPPSDTPHFAKKSDIVMLVATGGLERNLGTYSELLSKADFRLQKAHASPGLIQLIEASPS